jgi:hypothetical protein
MELNNQSTISDGGNDHIPNTVEDIRLDDISGNSLEWIKKNRAILIIHGIGNQLPSETLDSFGRGLIKQYEKKFPGKIVLQHVIVSKNENNKTWFDNVIRIRHNDFDGYIDLYEYYWASETEDKASWNDIQKWLRDVVHGAQKYYKKNEELGKEYADKSVFFTKDGKFKVGTYYFFLCIIGNLFIFFDWIRSGIMSVLFGIPYVGKLLKEWMSGFIERMENRLSNVIGDVTIYNVSDPKSKWFDIHRRIQDNAVTAVKYLIENTSCDEKGKKFVYESVIVAGHSLGSQIAYDAINKINLLINEGIIDCYNKDGSSKIDAGISSLNIADRFGGLITFGCPLDKIAFFFRENMPDEMYVRKQVLDHYHDFKQRDWNKTFMKDRAYLNKKMAKKKNAGNINAPLEYYEISSDIVRLLDDIKWRNYFDKNDYVSGGLDYYHKLTNIDCKFGAKSFFAFTHSDYWAYEAFYADIIREFLS